MRSAIQTQFPLLLQFKWLIPILLQLTDYIIEHLTQPQTAKSQPQSPSPSQDQLSAVELKDVPRDEEYENYNVSSSPRCFVICII